MRPIDQSTILVTGATDGLGRALAERLHAEGAQLLAHGRDPAKLDALREELPGIRTLQADFSSLGDVRRLAADAGEGDVLVNNAGLGSGRAGGPSGSTTRAWAGGCRGAGSEPSPRTGTSCAFRSTTWPDTCSRSSCLTGCDTRLASCSS